MSYHRFKAEDGSEYGSFEVFQITKHNKGQTCDEEGKPLPCGWYWVAGFPGCLWDGSPMGPFASERKAIRNAREE